MLKSKNASELEDELKTIAPEVLRDFVWAVLVSLYGESFARTVDSNEGITLNPDKEWTSSVLDDIQEDLRSAGLTLEDEGA